MSVGHGHQYFGGRRALGHVPQLIEVRVVLTEAEEAVVETGAGGDVAQGRVVAGGGGTDCDAHGIECAGGHGSGPPIFLLPAARCGLSVAGRAHAAEPHIDTAPRPFEGAGPCGV
ncbi:hypothetical protein GCM10010121_021550 [Streptomyces brasiliensis]|uniref:Uncharacterized protein n=1 Tax=Streptomyces brasiliensis TaxID=1954 RepID=A0A917KI98_9ACTN|nr:hypothetical protein GCM10010121_021550 [Streptomyces brasiliensis]